MILNWKQVTLSSFAFCFLRSPSSCPENVPESSQEGERMRLEARQERSF